MSLLACRLTKLPLMADSPGLDQKIAQLLCVQAAFFRQIVARRCSVEQTRTAGNSTSPALQQHQQQQSSSRTPGSKPQQQPACGQDQLDAMLAESLQYAKEDVQRFEHETQRAGWNIHPIMLSSDERASFSPI